MPLRILDVFRRGDASTALWGKHRGTVVENFDPAGRARLKVRVPGVLGTASVWALPALSDPCLSSYVPPEIGAAVWVEFEGGDSSLPIWTGFFWTG